MSHPNPHHDRENEYPSDDYRAKSKALKKKKSKRDSRYHSDKSWMKDPDKRLEAYRANTD